MALQDAEYKVAGMVKQLQWKGGSTLCAHGAISLWRRDILGEVFRKHDTEFHGEDQYVPRTSSSSPLRRPGRAASESALASASCRAPRTWKRGAGAAPMPCAAARKFPARPGARLQRGWKCAKFSK